MQQYNTVASRNLIKAQAQMLKHAEPIEVLGKFGAQKDHPKHSTDTLVFRRVQPFNVAANGAPQIVASNFVMAEGATPSANTISYQDVSVTMQKYGVLFKFSEKAQNLYEDDIPGDMKKIAGETMAEVFELVRYGVVKGSTSVIYANGASRAAVNTPISLGAVRKAKRNLENARGKAVTSMIAPGPNFGTKSVEPGYICFCHTNCEADVRDLPKFTRVEDYGSRSPLHPREIGAVESTRYITSPLLTPYLAAGSGTLNGMLSAGGANVDVYPYIVIAEEAWGQVAMKGLGAMTPVLIPASQRSHANPMGQFGYVGCDGYFAAVRLNENWMQVIEAGATSL